MAETVLHGIASRAKLEDDVNENSNYWRKILI